MTCREHLLVELVSPAGTATGTCTVAEAHAPPGRLHRAFSVLLYDHAGRILLQRRAAAKTRFAGRWSNTCCGHPEPGQDVATAAARRLSAELGLSPGQIAPFTDAGVLRYHAADPESGLAEREWDHILVATFQGGDLAPDEAEVSDCRWLSPEALRAEITAHPGSSTPWLPGVLDRAGPGPRDRRLQCCCSRPHPARITA